MSGKLKVKTIQGPVNQTMSVQAQGTGQVQLGTVGALSTWPLTQGLANQVLSVTSPGVLGFSNPSATSLTSASVAVASPNLASTTSTASPLTQVIPSMTLTPPVAGTYLILFEGCFYYNFAGSTFPPTGPWIEIQLFNNGTAVANSLRRFEDTNYLPASIIVPVVYAGTGAIEVRWRTTNSANPANVEGRALTYIRIA